ncbi:lipid-A-disaccharide synthase [Galbibacter pacificus]|uniref:Lipid-A-disaccharide synthase n=1 Tax=Galbibacter pacificus TaxID=2996052 RepID=A0ABT6FW54_9FLAO|nr:lipid-A-disaccharide synthase [Galbibacter pacificus]MDG3584069.1 lipid-A-disaccharide synthase [Galbibacter pacificus]MDG3587498.1 lipid-A-disaccharide synthase [Galbibacter pacificus]
MKYYIIAGEASGDLHASNLIKALSTKDKEATFRGWGGDLMQQAGMELVKHYKEQSFMGFFEVIMNLRTIFSNIKYCKQDIENFNPDVIIFIDYSGFNLKIAKWAKQHNYRTFYYVSPQIWASREGRIEAIKRDIDEMFVILPFEKDFYETKHQYRVNFVGHPLLDAISSRKQVLPETFREENGLDKREIIALLPGSRKQEITNMLSTMLSVVDDFTDYQFVIAGAPSQEYQFYEQFIGKANVNFVTGKTYDLLSVSKAALVTSGTATLETALFKVPEVVCYKGNWISYQIAKRIITLKYISLVNLIMDKEVVKELIQNDLTTKNLKTELHKILTPEIRERIFLDYFELEKKLGGKGASMKAAQLIYDKIS